MWKRINGENGQNGEKVIFGLFMFYCLVLLGLLDNVFMGIFAIYGVIWFYVWFYMYYQGITLRGVILLYG